VKQVIGLVLTIVIAAAGGMTTIGRVDTVGGTTYDWQTSGPMPQRAYCDPGYGVHAAWMYSSDTGSTYPDRNTRYNYYDFSTRAWNWIDPDYMVSGTDVFTERVGFGNIAVDPNTGRLHVCVHAGFPIHPILARDIARGAGIFEYCSGSPICDDYAWPLVAVGQSGKPHVAMLDYNSQEMLHYSRVDPWCNWSTPFHIPPPMPDPGFPFFLIAASRRRTSVCLVWADPASTPRRFYYRRSTDDGITWLPPESLPLPPAFSPGGDTTASGVDLYPWYDPDEEEDNVHLVASVIPIVAETARVAPAEVWHWREGGDWSRVARADCDPSRMRGGVGYNAVYACRPSLGKSATTGELICVWEQFDSSNVEPRTGLLRADIWAARGDSMGRSWGRPVRLTEPDSTSKRFPSLAGLSAGDTSVITYLVDLCAGFATSRQGPATYNPYAVQWVPVESLPPVPSGIAGQPGAARFGPAIAAEPNPFRQQARLSFCAPSTAEPRISICDAAGRPVAELAADRAGAVWDARDVAPGVYFCRFECGSVVVSRKLTLLP